MFSETEITPLIPSTLEPLLALVDSGMSTETCSCDECLPTVRFGADVGPFLGVRALDVLLQVLLF